ncbi:hypothetical protein BGZ47_003379 [Haplosporangium gracile]|nr:hypothetical protein BGZ47_003379 [Haplosporangium gracile]
MDEDAEDEIVTLDTLEEKKKLLPTAKLSRIFGNEVPEGSIHILVQRPSQPQSDALHPEFAALRKQLSDILDSSIKLGIIVKPEKKVAFTWPAIVETATLDNLRKNIFNEYPQYALDEYLEIFVYNGQAKPARIVDNEDLRKILKITKKASKTKLTISLETPSKSFAAWTFKDVCEEYGLSVASDPELEALPLFTNVQSLSLESDFEKATQDHLIKDIEAKVDVLPLRSGNEATKSMVVASFLMAATRLFKDDFYLMSQRHLSGRRGNGPVDFSVHPRKTDEYTLGVTAVKREDFQQGVAQNIVQLESALMEKKRKRGMHNIDGQEEPPSKQRAYGIVTDAAQWAFVECTMYEDKNVSFKLDLMDASDGLASTQEELEDTQAKLEETQLELQNTHDALVNIERARQAANIDHVLTRPPRQQEGFVVLKFQSPQPLPVGGYRLFTLL